MNKSKWLPFITLLFVVLVGFLSFGIKYCNVEQEANKLKQNVEYNQHLLEQAQHELQLTTRENRLLEEQLNMALMTIEDIKNNECELIYLGDFKLTHYCIEAYEHICGTGTGLTATGTYVTTDRTIAVDPKVIPYGSKVYIEGYGWRIAEDCGGAVNGNHIDVAVETHAQALSMGTLKGGVWLLVEKSS